VARNLKDAALAGLSADNKFGLAYEAALILAKMAVACAGYRVKGSAHHRTTFEALPLAMGRAAQANADFFEQCRRSRNLISYDVAGIITASQAATVYAEATAFEQAVEVWIAALHPALRK